MVAFSSHQILFTANFIIDRPFLTGLLYANAIVWSDYHMPMCLTMDRGTKISDSDSGVLTVCSLSFLQQQAVTPASLMSGDMCRLMVKMLKAER